MDSSYIGRTGSTPTGQYAMSYFRESGGITARAADNIQTTMNYFNGPNNRKDRVDNPIPWVIDGKTSFVVLLMVPIINPRTNEVVGGVGFLLDPSGAQAMLLNTIRDFDDISIMVLYTNQGTILAHFIPERLGKNVMDVDVEYGEYRQAAFRTIQEGKTLSFSVFDPTVGEKCNFFMHSFFIGNSDTSWTILMGTMDSIVMHEINAMIQFAIILALIAIAASALILYFVLSATTKPIIQITEALREISEGEGDLTRDLAVTSQDELGDLARYFNQTLKSISSLIREIKNKVNALTNTGHELAANMTKTSVSVDFVQF
jgi:methyl-accepting chemotaxis protein